MMLARNFRLLFSLRLCVFAGIVFSVSCSSKPTDLRSLAPGDSLIYLETNDLGAALQPIIDSKAFNEAARSKPDLSAIKGVQLAVAVTGFETTENKLNDENSELNFKPHFVAIADTHAWEFQTNSFVRGKLDAFVNKIYGDGVKLETTQKDGGTSYVWTAADGRKTYAFVTGSLILFGNDESSIERVKAVRRGDSDAISKTGKVPVADGNLAAGYVSIDGIGQLANIVGLKFASEAGGDSEVQSAIAGILPQLLRNSITEIRWSATRTEHGIDDKYLITVLPDIANVFSETMVANDSADIEPVQFLPSDLPAVSLYNFKTPQTAWRSLLLTAQRRADPLTGKMLGDLSSVLFEPYGIRDPERFLSTAKSAVVTAKCDKDGEKPFVFMETSDVSSVKASLDPKLKFREKWTDPQGGQLWATGDNDLAAYFDSSLVAAGAFDCVETISKGMHWSPDQLLRNNLSERIQELHSQVTTIGYDQDIAVSLAELLSELKPDVTTTSSSYKIETRFIPTGIERHTVSDFGLIGTIIAQLGAEE